MTTLVAPLRQCELPLLYKRNAAELTNLVISLWAGPGPGFKSWYSALRRWTWTGEFKCREVKTGFCRNRSMQTGSSGTLIGWKSGQTTFVPLWDWMEGAWLRTLSNSGCWKWKAPSYNNAIPMGFHIYMSSYWLQNLNPPRIGLSSGCIYNWFINAAAIPD
jgi:hypothetical protein